VIEIGSRIKSEAYTSYWNATLTKKDPDPAKIRGIQITHHFMDWNDIIRKYWIRSAIEIIYYFFSIHCNKNSWLVLNKVRKQFFPAFLSGLFPLMFFLVYIISLGFIFYLTKDSFVINSLSALSISLKSIFHIFTAITTTYIFYKIANHIGVLWILRIYRFNILFAEKEIKEITFRQKLWVEEIIKQQTKNPVDEIILCGHSVGTLLIVRVIDMLMSDDRWVKLQGNKKTYVLTLGQCYPFITSMPSSREFNQAIEKIIKNRNIVWLDVTARIDPLCFHGMHPIQISKVETSKLNQPILYSARFFKMYEKNRWAKIKRNKILVHFLYLMSPDKKCGFNIYDFFYGPDNFDKNVFRLTHAKTQA
jgi:hypothetical protein